MKGKRYIPMVLVCLCILLGSGVLSQGIAEDYVAKKGLAVYQKDLTKLVEQSLALNDTDRGQLDMLNRLFEMKFHEAEQLFTFFGNSDTAKRRVADLYLLKAIENNKAGNKIQAYFALLDAESWNKDARKRTLRIAGNYFPVSTFSKELEKEMRKSGNNVKFLIATFPAEQMYHPEKIVLAKNKEDEREPFDSARTGQASNKRKNKSTLRTGEADNPLMKVTEEDEQFLLSRFRKALYAYFYDPIESNAEFTLYLPFGSYHVYEKEFAVRPEEFDVTLQESKVNLQPAQWFVLGFSEEVHPSNISLSFHGVEWKDLGHVPFGRYRVKVSSPEFTYPVVNVTFVEKEDMETLQQALNPLKPEATVVVEDRGTCSLGLKKRDSNEKLRYSFLGY